MKFLPPEWTRDPDAKARFLHEAQAASKLDHPNICTVYEINETDDGKLFIAMAYYDGESLNEKVSGNPLSVSSAIEIAIQIAQGLPRFSFFNNIKDSRGARGGHHPPRHQACECHDYRP